LLELVGLPRNTVDRYPHEFSGGQRQRIVIARALALNPDFVVCDEPVSALDVSMQAQIINLLLDLQDRLGVSYLFIAHDLAVVRAVSARVAVMYAGSVVETAPKTQIYPDPQLSYPRALLDAVPRADPDLVRQPVVAGEVSSLLDPPPGCSFHPRCPFSVARGRVEQQMLKEPGPVAVSPATSSRREVLSGRTGVPRRGPRNMVHDPPLSACASRNDRGRRGDELAQRKID